MFRSEGTARTARNNQIVAAYLAVIAGSVNSAGFLLIGSFTSHVTGNVGRLASDITTDRAAAPFALLLVLAFFAGACVASMALETTVRSRPRVYSILLFVEAALLAAFAGLSYLMDTRDPRYRDVEAALLCFAMGMQNSFVTRLSGAVIRTTHLTGVVTDLGIETARWFRLWRARLSRRANIRLVIGDAPALEPSRVRVTLLLTIVVSFSAGSVVGAATALWWGQLGVLLPSAALFVGGVLAASRAWFPPRDAS